jgi:hypothetical protein
VVTSGTAGTNGWYVSSSVEVTLTAADALSGVESITYSVDGGVPVVVYGSTAIVTVSGDLVHSLSYYATDNAGNQETPGAFTVQIDSTPPDVTLTASRAPDDKGYYTSPVTWTVSGVDALSGVVSVDGPFEYSGPDTKTASVTGHATDAAGNVGEATVTFKYDATAPVVTITAPVDGAYYQTDVPAGAYSIVESDSYDVVVDGWADNPDGVYTYTVTATDAAGNVGSASVTYTVDNTAPTGSIVINSGNPATTTTTSVTLYLTYSDTTSGVYQVRYANTEGSWSSWEAPSATKAWTLSPGDGTKYVYYQIMDNAGITSSIYYDSIILQTTGEEKAYLVVRGSNNGIYCKIYDVAAETWSAWTSLPGQTPDSPATAVINNELHLVVRGMTGDTIWHGYINLDTQTFSGFTQLTGTMPSAPILTGNSTHLCLVIRGSNNAIYYRFYEVATRTWGDWIDVPGGTTTSTPAAALVEDELHVAVRGSSGSTIWHGSVDLDTGGFSGWTLLDGTTPSPPVLTSNSTHLCLVIRGSNDAIFYRWYDLTAETWGEWTSFPFGSTPDVPAATITGDNLQIVVRGMVDDFIWHGTLDLTSNTWSGWTQVDGSTPSKPVLTS